MDTFARPADTPIIVYPPAPELSLRMLTTGLFFLLRLLEARPA
jgi:hypothetical protein